MLRAVLFDFRGVLVDDALVQRGRRDPAHYRRFVEAGGWPLFPGAAELAREAMDDGVMLGVVSSAPGAEVEGALEASGIRRCFKAVVCGEDVESPKPAPDGYLLAMERLNGRPPLPSRLIHPHEVLVIEDSPDGIAAAASAGFLTVALAQTFTPEELHAADVVVPGIGGLDLDGIRRLHAAASAA